MAYRAATSTNGYLPTATGQVVNFVRTAKHFKVLNRCCQYTPSDLPTGVYAKLDPDNSVRTVNKDQFRWMDGAPMPTGAYFKSRFTTAEFRTQRYAYPWTIGGQAQKNARLWNPKLTHMMEAISLALTLRTQRMMTLLETSGTWAGNTASATTLGGGKWDAGTVAAPYFAKGVLAAAGAINLATNGVVEINDLFMIVNRDDAIKLSKTAEMLDFLKGSVWTQQMITDPFAKVNMQWGLPSHYQGVEIVVSTEPKVTETANTSGSLATTNRGLIKSSDSIIFGARPGSMDNTLSEKSYATAQVMYYAAVSNADKSEGDMSTGKDGLMQVKGRFDDWNDLWEGAVVEQTAEVVAAPSSGYLATDVIT